jgi:hypothetical protein
LARAGRDGDLNEVLRALVTLTVCLATVVSIAPESAAVAASKAPAHAKRSRVNRKNRCRAAKHRPHHGKRRRRTRCVASRRAGKRGAHAAAAKRRRPVATTSRRSKPSPTKAPSPAKTPTSTTTSPTPAGATTATWAPANHIETWAYDDCYDGGSRAPASVVRQWVTYAEANCGPGGDAKALSDCHSGSTTFCTVIQYLDTNWIFPTASPPWSSFSGAASESWFQHVPGSTTTRATSNGYGGGYLINQSNPAVQSFFQSYVRSHYGPDDGLMMDDQSSSLTTQLWYTTCGCRTTNELGSDGGLRASHEAMSAAMTHSGGQPYIQFDNTLPANPYLPQGFDMLNRSTGVYGLIKEGSPEYNGRLDPYYSTLLDEIAYASNATSGFVVPLSYGQPGASYQQQSRRVQEGTVLLGYSPGHVVDWANLEQNSGDVAVWPEEGIYPTQPVQSMGAPAGSGCLAGTGSVCAAGGHNDVQVAPGVYRREFAACYNQGAQFGPCAAIVNTTGNSVTIQSSWLRQAYGHQVTFVGGDAQSGGTVNLTGASFTPGVSVIGGQDATLLAP